MSIAVSPLGERTVSDQVRTFVAVRGTPARRTLIPKADARLTPEVR
jgi:hypothetical protein